MAYNRKNLLKTIIRIQEIVLEEQEKDSFVTLKEIFYKRIDGKVLYISYRTYESYLGVPAKRDLKRILEAEQRIEANKQKETPSQLNLFK